MLRYLIDLDVGRKGPLEVVDRERALGAPIDHFSGQRCGTVHSPLLHSSILSFSSILGRDDLGKAAH